MTCVKSEQAVMLYHENRINPIKSISLHQHLKRCESCREMFLIMDETVGTAKTPPDFAERIMTKLPPMERTAKPALNIGMYIYALFLALILALMYSDFVNITPHEFLIEGLVNLFQMGQVLIANIVNATYDFTVQILILAVATGLTVVGIENGRKSKIRKLGA
ncbi:MAG: hypothetical protein FWG65_05295 [Turicibacter sp.]|nr:hypothetical protein [Turicibacter sp.]